MACGWALLCGLPGLPDALAGLAVGGSGARREPSLSQPESGATREPSLSLPEPTLPERPELIGWGP